MQALMIEIAPAYPVCIGTDFLLATETLASCVTGSQRPIIITESTVGALYGQQIAKKMQQFSPIVLEFPAGEANKTRETKAMLEDAMLQYGCNRDSVIIALGGGVVCDLSGFLAATYCRGISAVYLPTSLLAMVDASVGGKTAVNTPYGKNMIGTFHQPVQVLMDLHFLQTLPASELNNGLAEMIKHALLADGDQLNELHQRYNPTADTHWLLDDMIWLENILLKNIAIKKNFVEQDEKDTGVRQLLNFGHTIGHVVEQLSNYSVSHGHAVLIGMLVESYLSMQMGHLSAKDFDYIEKTLKLCDVPLFLPYLQNQDQVLSVLRLDKKAQSKKIYCALLQGIGKPMLAVQPINDEQLEKALIWYNDKVEAI